MEILAPNDLWQDFKPNLNLDINIAATVTTDSYVLKKVYFNGIKEVSGTTRIYADFIFPKLKTKKAFPTLIICQDFANTLDETILEYYVNLGYACILCDTYGESKKAHYTLYNKDLAYANANYFKENGYDKTKGITETIWWQRSVVNLQALEFLKLQSEVDIHNIGVVGYSEGVINSYHLCFAAKEHIKTHIALFYLGWNEFGVNLKYDDEKEADLDSYQIAFIMGIAPQSYSPLIDTPTLFLGATNNQLGNIDRGVDTLARSKGEAVVLMHLSPNSNTSIHTDGVKTMHLWLAKYLKNKDVALQPAPMMRFETYNGELMAKCEVEDSLIVKCVNCYFSQGITPWERSYTTVEMTKNNNDLYQAVLNVYDDSELLFSYCNVEFTSGLTISSSLSVLEPKQYGISQNLIKHNIIYNGINNLDDFTGLVKMIPTKANEIFLNRPVCKLEKGAMDIEGITSPYILATYKLSSPAFCGEVGKTIAFSLCAKVETFVKVIALTRNGGTFFKEVKIIGGDNWQNYNIDIGEFMDGQMAHLKKWSDITLLMLKGSEEGFLLNNMLWI